MDLLYNYLKELSPDTCEGGFTAHTAIIKR